MPTDDLTPQDDHFFAAVIPEEFREYFGGALYFVSLEPANSGCRSLEEGDLDD